MFENQPARILLWLRVREWHFQRAHGILFEKDQGNERKTMGDDEDESTDSEQNSPRTINRLLWLIIALFVIAAAVFLFTNWGGIFEANPYE